MNRNDTSGSCLLNLLLFHPDTFVFPVVETSLNLLFPQCSEEELKETFSSYGRVLAVSIPKTAREYPNMKTRATCTT